VTQAFCSLFDVVIVHHNTDFISANWEILRHSRTVWRTIGQELHFAEEKMRAHRRMGLKIVRWSPEERHIRDYIGDDAVIRAAKEPEEWCGWTGGTARLLTFNNNFRARGDRMSFAFHQQCVAGLPFDLYGLLNDGVPAWRGVADPEEQHALLRGHRIAFITGTNPAPYTLGFVEAWMTGIPVVHVGRQRFSAGQQGVYEIDHLIANGENGFLVDEEDEARDIFDTLLRDRTLCEQVSAKGRAAAIGFFGRDRAAASWSAFLATL
jgi:hypothetical protein